MKGGTGEKSEVAALTRYIQQNAPTILAGLVVHDNLHLTEKEAGRAVTKACQLAASCFFAAEETAQDALNQRDADLKYGR